jgi:nucleoside-diphosphate-sugar epimerase
MSSDDVHAAVFGTLAVLRACNAAGVSSVVMTSGVCAAMPQLEPAVRRESDWSDAKEQAQNDNKYAASKTLAELAAWKFVEQEMPSFRFATILPSCIVGPSLSCDLCITNKCLLSLMKYGPASNTLPDECLSFIDVRDCASLHIAAMENPAAQGRYFSSAPSLHWNDLIELVEFINPRLPSKKTCRRRSVHGSYDLARQTSLGIQIRDVSKILSEAVSYFKVIGVQEAITFSEEGVLVSAQAEDEEIRAPKRAPRTRYSSYNEFGLPPESSIEISSSRSVRNEFVLKGEA